MSVTFLLMCLVLFFPPWNQPRGGWYTKGISQKKREAYEKIYNEHWDPIIEKIGQDKHNRKVRDSLLKRIQRDGQIKVNGKIITMETIDEYLSN